MKEQVAIFLYSENSCKIEHLLFKGPVQFWGVDHMDRAQNLEHFSFTALLENLTVKSYEWKR
jgi:hypothetical protein